MYELHKTVYTSNANRGCSNFSSKQQYPGSAIIKNDRTNLFKGEWALPGGYNAKGETTTDALERVVFQKTGVKIKDDLRYIEQLYTFDTINRDPRGHAVSVTYMGCGRNITYNEDLEVCIF